MKRRFKRHVIIPLLLLIYISVMAVMSFPRYKETGNWGQFATVIGISLIIIVVLFLVYKRREKLRDKFNNKN